MATRSTASGRRTDGGRMLSYLPGLGDFAVPLKTTLAPIAGFGAITYTRLDPAYVPDNEGVLHLARASEARFEGARRVENLATYSQDFTNAIWSKTNTTIGAFTDTIGSIPTYTLTDNATSGSHTLRYNTSFIIGNTYCYSAYVKAGTSSYCQFAVASVSTNYANFDLSNGTITAGQTSQATITPVSGATGWYRISLYFTATITSTQFGGLFMITAPNSARAQTYVGSGSTIRVAAFQIEDITGQSILSPAEYVSTNVLNAFPYHGAGVDGVKYFDTTLTGAKIPESTLKGFMNEGQRINSFLQSESMVTSWTAAGATAVASPIAVPTGMLSGCKLIPNAGTQASQTYQSITTSATNYTFSVYAKAGECQFLQLRTHGSISSGYVNFDLVNGTFNAPSTWAGDIEALPNGWYRCIAMTEVVAAATNNVVIQVVSSLSSALNEFYTGNGSDGLYLWGGQWENATFASSLIPSTTTSLTRRTDYLTYNVANTVTSQGSISREFTLRYIPSAGVDRRAIGLSGNTNNRLMIRATDTSGIQNRSGLMAGNGATVLTIYNSFSCVQNVTYKVSSSWLNGGNATFNASGVNLGNVGPVSIATTQVDIGSTSSGSSNLFGNIKNVKIWKTVIDSDALRLLTN